MKEITYSPALEWIDCSDLESRSRINAHVARERRYRKSFEDEQSMRLIRSRKLGNQGILVSSVSKWQTQECMLGTVHPELLGAGRRDPFANYPLENLSKVELELLDHCK